MCHWPHRRKTALTRWLTTRHITGKYVDAFTAKEISGNDKPQQELGKSRRERDENDVLKIVGNAANIQNPFNLNNLPTKLTNIITGQIVSKEVRESLNNFLERGTAKNRDFITSSHLLQDKELLGHRFKDESHNFC